MENIMRKSVVSPAGNKGFIINGLSCFLSLSFNPRLNSVGVICN